MKHPLSPILLLLAIGVQAQKDFDYTFYTTRCDYTYKDSSSTDMKGMFMPRKIHKDADVIKIISITNTGDATTYNVHYVGYDTDSRSFIYITDEQERITINPVEAILTKQSKSRNSKASYY